MEKKVTSHIVKGVIIALIFIVLDLVAQFSGLKFESWYSWASGLLLLVVFIWATINYANQMDNAVTFGNAFAHGFKTSAVVACISFIYTLLLIYVIAPEFVDQVMEKGIAEAEKKGQFNDVSEEQLEAGMAMGKKIVTISMIAGSLIFTLIVGALGAVLGAAIAKKNPPPTPFQ